MWKLGEWVTRGKKAHHCVRQRWANRQKEIAMMNDPHYRLNNAHVKELVGLITLA